MKDKKNLQWTMKDIAEQYKNENLNWTWNECWVKARIVYRELNKLNYDSHHNDKIFFKMNTPFSFYYDKDSEFSNKFELRNG